MTRGKNGEESEIKDEPKSEIKIKDGPNRPPYWSNQVTRFEFKNMSNAQLWKL